MAVAVSGSATSCIKSRKREWSPQVFHARIYMKIDKPLGVLFIGFLQMIGRAPKALNVLLATTLA